MVVISLAPFCGLILCLFCCFEDVLVQPFLAYRAIVTLNMYVFAAACLARCIQFHCYASQPMTLACHLHILGHYRHGLSWADPAIVYAAQNINVIQHDDINQW